MLSTGMSALAGATTSGTFDSPARTQSAPVLHTMPHPDSPGRFITVFHANGADGWSRLRLVPFYTRDSTIVWEEDEVVARRLFEPDRRIVTR